MVKRAVNDVMCAQQKVTTKIKAYQWQTTTATATTEQQETATMRRIHSKVIQCGGMVAACITQKHSTSQNVKFVSF